MPIVDGVLTQVTVAQAAYRGELPDRESSIDDKYARTYRRTFLVETDDLHDAGAVATAAIGIPEIFAAYSVTANEKDLPALITRISARPHSDHPNLWAVACEYSTKPAHPDYQDPDPRQRKARRRTRFERFKEGVETDYAGTAIVNSANVPYAGIELDNKMLVIEIEKNLAIDPVEIAETFIDAVNTNAAFGKQAYQLKVHDVVCPDEDYECGVRFWPTKLILHCKPLTAADTHPWRLSLLDQGHEYRDGSGNLVPFRSAATGQVLSGDHLLDGAGGQLGVGGNPTYNEFVVHPELSFNPLINLFSL